MKTSKGKKTEQRVGVIKNVPSAVLQKEPTIFKPNLRFAGFCAVAAFLLYANTIGAGYVLDDQGVIVENQNVLAGFKGIPQLFSTDIWHQRNINLGYYRPLSLVTFAIENQFFPLNPHVSHFDNVLLYALTAFFLFILLQQIFSGYNAVFALLATLLFVAHPIHTEVVANIKSRDELLAFLNLVVALIFVLKAIKPQEIDYKFLGLSGLFFYLALLSKETAMIGVLFVPALLLFKNISAKPQIFIASGLFLILALLFQFQKYELIGPSNAKLSSDLLNYPYTETAIKVPTALTIIVWCLRLSLIPYPLSYSYAYNQIPAGSWTSIWTIAGIFIVAALAYLFFQNLRKKNALAAGIFIWGVALIPAMAFVILRGGIFAERFLYVSAVGVSIVATWLIFKVSDTSPQSSENDLNNWLDNWKFSLPLLAVLMLYAIDTFSRNENWHDNTTLFAHDVEVSPNSCQTHLHYGSQMVKNGILEKDVSARNNDASIGLEHLNAAANIDPQLSEAYYEIGYCYQYLKSNNDSAIYYYNRAILANSANPMSFVALGLLYEKTGQQKLASYYLNKGVEQNPNYTKGVEARDEHRKVTGLDIKEFPSEIVDTADLNSGKDFSYYAQMGETLGKKGDYVGGARYLEKAVEMNPNSVGTLINLSVCLASSKNYLRSIDVLNRVIVLDPNNVTAYNNLAIMYKFIGQRDKAEECRKKVKELRGQ